MTTTDEAAVERILDEIRHRVRTQRPAGNIAGDQALSELQAAIQDVNVNAKVNSHLPLLWESMVLGRVRALVQRVVRRLLRWYINPIVEQQNIFNAAVARSLTLLAAENARLQRENVDLRERLARIEKGSDSD